MTSDSDLLRQYLEHRDETAFGELVRRHLGLVYRATLRQTNGDSALAEDATQAAFTELARKAGSLLDRATVAGWLHTTARFHALRSVRGEQRRRIHEQEASAMNDPADSTILDAAWGQLRPVLDESLSQLRDQDRDAVLLRFFEEKSFRELGGILGVSENAAQMRVERALDKLRAQFTRRGVSTTAALFISALGAQAATPVPAGLAGAITEKSLAGGTVGFGVSPLVSKKLLLAGGVVALALLAFLLLFSIKNSPVNNIAQSKNNPPSTTPPMTPSQIINAGTLAAALLAVTPTAIAQNDASPVPPAAKAEAASVSELVTANNRFALDLFRQFAPKPNENAFFSPYSISTALAMTWTGAKGDTAAQMAKVLHFSELASKDVPAGFTALQQSVSKAQTLSGSQLSVANSLWAEQNPEHPFLQSFMDGALINFSAPVTAVDFIRQSGEAAKQINAWVENKTNDKIKELIHYPGDVDKFTRLVLVNAIYFKGQWQHPFESSNNINSEFHPAAGGEIPAVFMRTIQRTGYADITDGPAPCQIVSLDYSNQTSSYGARAINGISFMVILPRSPGDLSALSKSLTADRLEALLGRLTVTNLEIYLPKFKLEERYLLRDTLFSMGIRNAFIDPSLDPADPRGADFSGMDGGRNLFISKVIHQTFVDVNEKGTEAAAATAVVMLMGAAASAPPPEFRADHPFLFLIRDDVSGAILFLGQLANPDPLQEVIQSRAARNTQAAGPRGTNRGAFRGPRAAPANTNLSSPAATPPAPASTANQQ